MNLQIVSNWTEVVPLLHRLMADPVALDKLQARVLLFWTCFKEHLQFKAARVINRSFARHHNNVPPPPPPPPPAEQEPDQAPDLEQDGGQPAPEQPGDQ